MKKIRELLKEKRWKWTAGGVACLVAASMGFSTMQDIGVRADEISLGTETVDLERVSGEDHTYWIETAEQLRKIGNATEGTANLTFKLKNDITFSSVTTPASGNFEGTFDGEGHVIIYEDVSITVTDEVESNASVMNGLLFGSVSGTVEDLVVDIRDTDASYTRKTKNPVVPVVAEPVYEEQRNPIIGEKESVSGLSDDAEELKLVEEIFGLSSVSGTDFKTHTLRENGSVTTVYTAADSAEDYFGVLCGNVSGTVQQVYLTGNALTVEREELTSLDYSQSVQSGYREEVYYYLQDTDSRTEDAASINLSLAGTVYATDKTDTQEVKNEAFSVDVSVGKVVAKGEVITYKVTVSNQDDKAYTVEEITTTKAGRWNENFPVEIAAGTSKEFSFYYETADVTDEAVLMDFTVKGASEYTNVMAKVSDVHVKIFETAGGVEKESKQGLKIQASAPSVVVKGNDVQYQVILTNTGSETYDQVTLLAEEAQGAWSENKTLTLLAGEEKKVTFTYGKENVVSGQILMNFIAEAKNTATEESAKTIASEVATQILEITQKDWAEEAKGLSLKVNAVNAKQISQYSSNANVKYTITVSNTSDVAYENVKITSTKAGIWSKGDRNKTTDVFTISQIAANKSYSVDLTYSYSAEEITAGQVVASFTAERVTEKELAKVDVKNVAIQLFDKNSTTTKISQQGLQMDISVPKAASKGSTIDCVVTVQNLSDTAFETVMLQMKEESTGKEASATINELKANETKNATLTYVSAADAEKAVLRFTAVGTSKVQSVDGTGVDSQATTTMVSDVEIQLADFSEQQAPGVDQNLKMVVYSPKAVKKNDTIYYKIDVINEGTTDCENLVIQASVNGTWSETGAFVVKGADHKELLFSYTPDSRVSEGKVTFTLAGNVAATEEEKNNLKGDPVEVQVSNVTTTVFDASSVSVDESTAELKIEVSAPQTIKKGEEIIYTVKVTNVGDRELGKIKITNNDKNYGGVNFWSEDNTVELVDGTKELTYTYKPSGYRQNVSLQFTAEEIIEQETPENPEETVAEIEPAKVSVTSTITEIVDAAEQTPSQTTQKLRLDVSVPKAVSAGEKVCYKLKVTNESDQVFENLTAQSSITEGGVWSDANAFALNPGEFKELTYECTAADENVLKDVNFTVKGNIAATQAEKDALKGADINVRVENVITQVIDASTLDVDALKEGLYVSISVPKQIAKGNDLVYTVKLENKGNTKFSNITVNPTEGGTWNASNTFSLDAGRTKELKFTIATGAVSQETISKDFSVLAKQAGTEVDVEIQFATLETKLFDVSSRDIEKAVDGLTLNVLAPEKANAKVGDQIHYRVTVGNTGEEELKNIRITSEKNGEWIAGSSKTTGTVYEISSLPTGEPQTIEFVIELSETDILGREILTDFSAQGSTNLAETKVTVSDVKTRLFNATDISDKASAQGLQLHVLAPKTAKSGGETEYQVTITNMSENAYSDVVLNASKEGSWKEKNTLVLLGGEVKVLTFVCTAGTGEEDVVDFSITGKNATTSEEVFVKVSGITVQLIDASAEPKTEKISGMELKIEAPLVQRKEASQTVEYRMTVTNTSEQDYTDVLLTVNRTGIWNQEETETETYKIDTLEKGASEVLTFVSEISQDEFSAKEVAMSCTVSTTVGNAEVSVSSAQLKTMLLEVNADSMGMEASNGLKATLQIQDSNILEGEEFQYTLTLENKNRLTNSYTLAKNIQILTDLSAKGWEIESCDAPDFSLDDVASQVLPVGKKVVLKKAATETVEGNGVSNVYVEALNLDSALTVEAYKYVYDSEVKEPVFKDFVADATAPETSGDVIISGNTLYAGGIAGTIGGTVTQIKQSMDLFGTEGEELVLGGIAGKTDAPDNWSHIYMPATVNDVSKYAGTGTVLPENSATSASEASDMQGNDAWATYEKYLTDGDDFETENVTDLKWLIKTETDETGYFTFAEPVSSAIEVTISESGKVTDQALSYVVTYNARRSMNDETESSVYKSVDGTLELGSSGYYRLLGAYATDGYYHYNIPKVSLGEAAWIYPYHETKTENPYVIAEQGVVRSTTNPLEDQIQIQISNATSGMIYYEETFLDVIPNMGAESNTVSAEIRDNGKVTLPFQIDRIRYRMVPVIDGHIYPTLTTKEFSQSDKQPLPKPMVTCYDYYDVNGNKKEYVAFGADSYEAGTDMMLLPAEDEINDESYSFRYVYSTVQPGEGWNEEQRYLGNGASFMNGMVDYIDSALIPENLVGEQEVYLYVEMSKKNYDSQYYYFGPFAVTQGDKLSADVISNGKIIEGYSLLDGDRVMISSSLENAVIQYAVSKAPTNSWDWKEYSEEGISMSQEQGGYVYARIKYDDTKYSKEVLFDYTFGGLCADPRVTPNTGISSNGSDAAATVGASTNITLSSRTPEAEIFYMVSDETQLVTMERALELPAEITADGMIGSDGYKYFKVGSRWYRTSYTAVERYSEGVVLSHGKKDAQLMYLSAVALAEGYESSAVLEYIYRVQPVQQVSNPEGAFDTRHMPGGETTEVSNIALGARISFFSVTPEAKLYYEIGSGTEEPTKEMPADGIVVEGNYGGNFVVRVQAKKDGMLDSEIVTFVYAISDQELASAPTATPGTSADVPTTVIPGNKILLSTTTKEASIFYTTDGSSPKVNENEDGTFSPANESTKLYDPNAGIVMPADAEGYFSITAVTVRADLAKSVEAHFIYVYPGTVLKPYANIDSGKVDLNAVVVLKNLTEDAVIYYNVAYGEQEPADPTIASSVFSEEYPFIITQKTTIKAIAAKNGVKSSVATFVYEPMERLSAPEASIASGSIVSRGTVLELKSAEGATIYYTMDGSDPTDHTNGAVMSGNTLTLNGEEGGQLTIKAYAMAEDKSQSEVATYTYQFSQNAGGVTASIESGSLVSNGTKVNLMSDVSDAEIYYTTNGSSPIENGRKGTIVEINGTPGGSFTVKAVAVANNTPGTVATFIYKIKERPTEPTASPSGGTLTVATRVSLSSSAENIYYTTDGTEPTKSSALYSEPILINRTTILKAIAISEDGEVSEVSTFVYTAAEKAAAVASTEADGATLLPGTEVKLSTATEDAVIYYSTDGTEPTLDNLEQMLVYDGEYLEINRSVMIQAVAYREDLRLSDVAVWNYSVDMIPAQQMKKAEEAKKAEEGLRDTDASALERNTDASGELNTRILRESVNETRVLYPEDVLPEQLQLETIKEENSPLAIEKAKAIFGEDNTVLGTYQFKVKKGTTVVQPNGKVEIAIPIPEGYEDAAMTIAYVEEGHNLKTLETRREIGTLYAKTMKLGTYVILGPEREHVEDSQFSYLLILEIAAGIALFGGVVFLIKEKIKKRREKR